MKDLEARIERDNRWFTTAAAFTAFLAALGLALSPHLGWLFMAAPTEEGRLAIGPGQVALALSAAVFSAVTARRQGVRMSMLIEATLILAVSAFWAIFFVVVLLPTASMSLVSTAAAIILACFLRRRVGRVWRRPADTLG